MGSFSSLTSFSLQISYDESKEHAIHNVLREALHGIRLSALKPTENTIETSDLRILRINSTEPYQPGG
jgi:hypothetical protein